MRLDKTTAQRSHSFWYDGSGVVACDLTISILLNGGSTREDTYDLLFQTDWSAAHHLRYYVGSCHPLCSAVRFRGSDSRVPALATQGGCPQCGVRDCFRHVCQRHSAEILGRSHRKDKEAARGLRTLDRSESEEPVPCVRAFSFQPARSNISIKVRKVSRVPPLFRASTRHCQTRIGCPN